VISTRWRLKRYRPIDQRTLPVAAVRQTLGALVPHQKLVRSHR
jgi:hypothetical protein